MKILALPHFLLGAAAVLASTLQPALADEVLDGLKKEVVETYGAIAGQSSADAQLQAETLQNAVAAFTASPSAESLAAAKQAWIAARLPYLQSEILRFKAGLETDPFDPASVDYLKAKPKSGIINDTEQYPNIDKILVASLGTKSGGYPAIEFLLWGEDLDLKGPGNRSFEDYIKEKNPSAERRALYLNACAVLVAEKAAAQAASWKADVPDNLRAKFLATPTDEILATICTNVSTLAGDRIAKKIVGTAYEARKDESSNFSDTTHFDLIYACSGIGNIVAGAYVGLDKEIKVQGAGLLKLAEALGERQAEDLKLATNDMMLAVTEFRPPFDRALIAPDDSPAREAIRKIKSSLEDFSRAANDLAKGLGLAGTEPGE